MSALAEVPRPAPIPRPFTFRQALERGWTRSSLRRAVAAGEVTHVLRGVYVLGRPDLSFDLRLACLALVLPRHAVAVDRTAAWLWNVALSAPPSAEPPPLEFYVLRGHSRIRRVGASSGERDLTGDDVIDLGGVKVTTPARTAMDLACRLGRPDALAVLDAFARVQGVVERDLAAMLPRFRGRRGVVQARGLIPLMDERAESSGESFTRLAILDSGLPAPLPQHWITVGGVPTYRLDLAYPRQKIAVEYDGQDFHTDEADRERDEARREWLREHGWIVIVVWKEDLTFDARRSWLGDLRDALQSRERWGRLART